jgi:hypothetical protein
VSPPTDQRGFQFPGTLELTAFGAASDGLVETVLAELVLAGVALDRESLSTRPSREGNFVAVRVAFHCESREQLERAHARLRALPAIKWTL